MTIEPPTCHQCLDERRRVPSPEEAIGKLGGCYVSEVAVFGVIQGVPPEGMQEPESGMSTGGHWQVKCLHEPEDFSVPEEVLVRLDPGHGSGLPHRRSEGSGAVLIEGSEEESRGDALRGAADLELEGRGDRGPVRFTENATQAQRRAAGRVEAVACTTKVYGLIDSQHTSSARRKWV